MRKYLSPYILAKIEILKFAENFSQFWGAYYLEIIGTNNLVKNLPGFYSRGLQVQPNLQIFIKM